MGRNTNRLNDVCLRITISYCIINWTVVPTLQNLRPFSVDEPIYQLIKYRRSQKVPDFITMRMHHHGVWHIGNPGHTNTLRITTLSSVNFNNRFPWKPHLPTTRQEGHSKVNWKILKIHHKVLRKSATLEHSDNHTNYEKRRASSSQEQNLNTAWKCKQEHNIVHKNVSRKIPNKMA